MVHYNFVCETYPRIKLHRIHVSSNDQCKYIQRLWFLIFLGEHILDVFQKLFEKTTYEYEKASMKLGYVFKNYYIQFVK